MYLCRKLAKEFCGQIHQIFEDENSLIWLAVFGVDVDGKVNVWNQHAAHVVGFTAEQTFGRPFVEDFITGDFSASVQDVLDKALRGEETANFQLPLVTANGTRVEILLNATTRKDMEGRIIGVVGIGQASS